MNLKKKNSCEKKKRIHVNKFSFLLEFLELEWLGHTQAL
jgi:hypothetical protein